MSKAPQPDTTAAAAPVPAAKATPAKVSEAAWFIQAHVAVVVTVRAVSWVHKLRLHMRLSTDLVYVSRIIASESQSYEIFSVFSSQNPLGNDQPGEDTKESEKTTITTAYLEKLVDGLKAGTLVKIGYAHSSNRSDPNRVSHGICFRLFFSRCQISQRGRWRHLHVTPVFELQR